MKMREELELYKGKCNVLENQILQLLASHTLELDSLVIAHNIEVSELVAAHKKVVDSKDGTLKYHNDQASELRRDLENLQDILDVIPGVLSRKKDGDYNGDNACHVRLASVLAQKFM